MTIADDVYNLTIAANMTNECSPASLMYCMKQCMFVFFLQVFVATMFSYEFRKCDEF